MHPAEGSRHCWTFSGLSVQHFPHHIQKLNHIFLVLYLLIFLQLLYPSSHIVSIVAVTWRIAVLGDVFEWVVHRMMAKRSHNF